tara:strand:- start:751 stop:1224 length:474 start_codon:yes stop_codon:yes gene_type:complete
MSYERFFGSGPTGLTATFFIWVAAYLLGEWLGIPPIGMNPTFWVVLLWFFVVDFAVTVIWSLLVLPVRERGEKLVTSGPYRLMRHPLYAAFIWSGTGAAAVWLQSWLLIFSVIPIHIFWVWHIRNEERFMLEQFGAEYKVYMETTGQFFPILRRDKK